MHLAIRKLLRGAPPPLAIIAKDEETLPSVYRGTNGYWRQDPAGIGYTGLSTYIGYAPWPVYFAGFGSSPSSEIVSYYWDFGAGTESDEGGRYFEGINAAHLFETPGNYTVTLTVTDKYGRTSSDTRTVTIHAGGAGNTSIYGGLTLNTYYVDPVIGDDTYDGLAQTVTGTNGPWKTFDKIVSKLHKTNNSQVSTWPLKPGDKVYLKRGATITLSSINTFGHGTMCQGVHIGAYGTGAKPKVQWVTPPAAAAWQPSHAYAPGDYILYENKVSKVSIAYTSSPTYVKAEEQNASGSTMLNGTGNGAGMLTITDVDFYCNDNNISYANGIVGCLDYGRNICAARCHFNEPYNVAFGFNPVTVTSLVQEPYGMFILGCTATQDTIATKSVVLLTYGCCAGLAILRTNADRSGNHINYLTEINSGIIADNTFSRPPFGRTALRMTGGPLTGPAQRVHVTRNKILGWIDPQSVDLIDPGPGGAVHNGGGTRYNYALVDLKHNGSVNKNLDNIIFERNILTNFEVGVGIVNHRSSILRNNIFVSPSMNANAIYIGESTGVNQVRVCDDVKITNNTFMFNGSAFTAKQIFIKLSGMTNLTAPFHPRLEISNNLVISTAGRDDVFIACVGDQTTQLNNMVIRNNLLDSPSTVWARNNSINYDLATWQSTFGADSGSIKSAANTVTLYSGIAHSPGFPDSMAATVAEADGYIAGLKLTSTSPAIGAAYDPVYGVNDVIAPVTVDFDGVRRTNVNNDIGAFESYKIISDFDVSAQGYVDQQAVSSLVSSVGTSTLSSSNALYQPIFNLADNSLIFSSVDADRLYSSAVAPFREVFIVLTNVSDAAYAYVCEVSDSNNLGMQLRIGSPATKWYINGVNVLGRVSAAKQLVHMRFVKGKHIMSTDGGVEYATTLTGTTGSVTDRHSFPRIYVSNRNFAAPADMKLHHIVTTTALNATQRAAVIASLKTKWGIA